MYRRPKFLEILLEIRREMALEADYDVDLLVESARNGKESVNGKELNEFKAPIEPLDINSKINAVRKQGRELRKR